MTSTVPCTAGNWAAAFLPILVLLVLMIQFRWRATEAAPMGLFAALIIALTVFRANSALIAAEAAKGIWSALVVLIVIWPALLMYEISNEANAFDSFRSGIRALLPNELVRIMAIGLGFVGFLNGVMIAKFKLPPFIATLGTQMATLGFGSIITSVQTQRYPTVGTADGWFKEAFYRCNLAGIKGFPIGAVYLLAAFIFSMILLNRTKFGRYVYAIGSNEEAARLSGVKTAHYKILVYTICGMFCALAGIFYAATYTTVIPGTGNGLEMNGITAVIIGGTSMAGGSGSMVGTLIGVLIMSVLKTGLPAIGLQSQWQTFITGIVVIGAVLFDMVRVRAAAKAK